LQKLSPSGNRFQVDRSDSATPRFDLEPVLPLPTGRPSWAMVMRFCFAAHSEPPGNFSASKLWKPRAALV
jgi:hypothetical protein